MFGELFTNNQFTQAILTRRKPDILYKFVINSIISNGYCLNFNVTGIIPPFLGRLSRVLNETPAKTNTSVNINEYLFYGPTI